MCLLIDKNSKCGSVSMYGFTPLPNIKLSVYLNLKIVELLLMELLELLELVKLIEHGFEF